MTQMVIKSGMGLGPQQGMIDYILVCGPEQYVWFSDEIRGWTPIRDAEYVYRWLK